MNQNKTVQSLLPYNQKGRQFVLYADSCSGTKGSIENKALSKLNSILQRLSDTPEFICFPGDEIIGLNPDKEVLRQQWNYWHTHEMQWIKEKNISLYNTTGNHTAYDSASEEVFCECNSHLPLTDPLQHKGLSYYVVDGDVLIIAVHTLCAELGGEGHIDLEWLEQVLENHQDFSYTFVMGHHPIFPVASIESQYELTVESKNGLAFWQLLKKYNVFAYLCSHILTYDVQVYNGVLQILSGGAGRTRTFVHAIQAAIDSDGLRYQVLDSDGELRSGVVWPPLPPDYESWNTLSVGVQSAPQFPVYHKEENLFLRWKFSGTLVDNKTVNNGAARTLLSGWNENELFTFWIGVIGKEQQLTILIRPEPTKSPRYWHGPKLLLQDDFEIEIAMHTGMGCGGILWRLNENDGWSSFKCANYWGAESIMWPRKWSIGFDGHDADKLSFQGYTLNSLYCVQILQLRKEKTKVDYQGVNLVWRQEFLILRSI